MPRTLLDLAEMVEGDGLERIFEEAERRRLLDLGAVEQTCTRGHGRRGLKPILAQLQRLSLIPETRSELERRIVALCRKHALPPPAVNVLVAGFEVDAAWRDRGLVVELDGYEYHGTHRAFERDRARDACSPNRRRLRPRADRLDGELGGLRR